MTNPEALSADRTAIHPVILCGGSGTRLWPLSRKAFPKQFIPLLGEKSLLQLTLERVAPLVGSAGAGITCVSSEEHRFLVAGMQIRWEGSGVNEKGYWVNFPLPMAERAENMQPCIISIDPRYFRPAEVCWAIRARPKASSAGSRKSQPKRCAQKWLPMIWRRRNSMRCSRPMATPLRSNNGGQI